MGKKTQYAGFWKRLLAYLVDFAIITPITLIVQLTLGYEPFGFIAAETYEQMIAYQNSHRVASLISLGIIVAYFVIMWANYNGATPGKRLMGLRVQMKNGGSLKYSSAFARFFGYLVSSFTLGLGFFWIAIDKQKQGFHDKIANTVVVKTGQKARTGIAILVGFLFLIYHIGYVSTAAIIGLDIVMRENAQHTLVPNPRDSISQDALPHYQKTQELYAQMNELEEPSAIRPLADQTIEAAQAAVEVDPNNPFLWKNLADAYTWPNTIGTENSELEAARQAIEVMDEDDPEFMYLNRYGDALRNAEQYEDAILQYQESLRLNDSIGDTYFGLGVAYANLGVMGEARENLNQAITIYEEHNDTGQFDAKILQTQKLLGQISQ